MIPSYGKKTYMTLGKVLLQKRPDVASELMAFCSVSDNETDLNHISVYFETFCRINDTPSSVYHGKLDTYAKMRDRRLFITAVLHIYCREVFQQPPTSPILPYGIVKALATSLNIKKSYTSRLIRNVLFERMHYDEFRDESDRIAGVLKNIQNHKEEAA